MYLIDTTLLTVKYFPDHSTVQYAILSHRWEQEEVTLQNLQEKAATSKCGYQKVLKACEQARDDGHGYLWIDTCCIDRASSADLSEAINSMFAWYRDASICYAYLSDVDRVEAVSGSVWFTRGWTLQELIAPAKIRFLDVNWINLGTKETLSAVLSRTTGIPVDVLHGRQDFRRLSIAQRMSWQAKRSVTRLEDIAYSLLGIMDVNMPLLYGEGMKAFRRLQEEIIKQTDDHTIFAWNLAGDNDTASGLLAHAPSDFAGCSMVARRGTPLQSSTFATTNLGLSIQLPLVQWSRNYKVALLNCVVTCKDLSTKPATVAIFLRPLDVPDQYARVALNGQDRVLFHASCFKGDSLSFVRDPEAVLNVLHLRTQPGPLMHRPASRTAGNAGFLAMKTTSMYIRENPLAFGLLVPENSHAFWLRKFNPFPKNNVLDADHGVSIKSWHPWDPKERRFVIPEGCLGAAFIIHVQGGQAQLLGRPSSALADREIPQEPLGSVDVTVPSMLFTLGVNKDNNVEGTLEAYPSGSRVAGMTISAMSDALVLSGTPSNIKGADTFTKRPWEACFVSEWCWNVFVSTRIIDGKEVNVVDLLWSGPQSQCDECGKVGKYVSRHEKLTTDVDLLDSD